MPYDRLLDRLDASATTGPSGWSTGPPAPARRASRTGCPHRTGQGGPARDATSVSSDWASWAARWPPTWSRAGHSVVGYDLSPDRVERLAEAGGKRRGSLAEAVARRGRRDHHAARLARRSRRWPSATDGVLQQATAGLLHIDMSTVRPETSRRVAQAGAVKGVRVLDAPVSGGERGRGRRHASRSWSAARAEDFAAATPAPRGRSARRSSTSGRRARARPSRPPTSSSSAASTPWSPRRSCCWRPRVSTRKTGLDVLAGGLAGSRDPRPQTAIDGQPRVRPGIPHRPAPQGHGHRDRRRTGGGRRPAADRAGRPARRRRPCPGARLARPLRPAQGDRERSREGPG